MRIRSEEAINLKQEQQSLGWMDFFIKKTEPPPTAVAPRTRGPLNGYKMSYQELIATIKVKISRGENLTSWEAELIDKHKEPYGMDELKRQ